MYYCKGCQVMKALLLVIFSTISVWGSRNDQITDISSTDISSEISNQPAIINQEVDRAVQRRSNSDVAVNADDEDICRPNHQYY